MKCTACQFENPAGARFCCQCGTALKITCSSCGTEPLPGARFCHNCAAPLPTATAPAAPAAAGALASERASVSTGDVGPPPPGMPGAADSERRHLTVMFCDLVGSTALSAQLDPEDLQSVVREYQALCEAMVQRFDGHIAQFLGDGILVYFGYPQAHEDDPHRGVRTGLAIVEAMQGLNEQLQPPRAARLQVRIGIHTGLVVIGAMGGASRRAELLALGETPNVAARIQGHAEPDSVLISSATHRLVEGFFECQQAEATTLKGIAQSAVLFKVLRESTARSRLDVIGKAGWTPLVGREQELGYLVDRWERIKEGFGEVVILTGEGGIGKSRLVHALMQHVAEDRQAWLTPLQGSAYHQSTALYPMIDFLNRIVLQFEKNETPEQKVRRIEGLLRQYGLPLAEGVPLLASLLGISCSHYGPPLQLSPERQKEKTLRVLESVLIERASRQPLLFVVEDLHWIDPTTLELLTLLGDQIPTRRILAVYTCRPQFTIAWKGRSHVTQMTLTRLTQRQIADMVLRLTQGKALPAEVFDQIVTKTDGVPLFVEELTKMVLESGFLLEEHDGYRLDRPLPSLAIPATLQDSLMARLDRLSAIKDVVQLGSILGREFSYEVMEAVADLPTPVLERELTQLVEAELLYQRGTPPQATFIFKHALLQEAAYQSLLKSKRQQHHRRIASVLTQRFPEIAGTQPEVMAHHWTEAGVFGEAIEYWRKAGEYAAQRSAHAEAVVHLTRALDSLAHLPETAERHQQEIRLRIALGPSLTAIKGYGARQVERNYTCAKALCEHSGEPSQLFLVLYGLWRLNSLRAQHATARSQGEELLQLASSAQSASFPVAAHRALGATLFYMGDLAGSRAHVEWVLDATSSPKEGSTTLFQDVYDVVDPRVTCRSYLSWNLWLLGYPDQARKESEAAITLAQTLQHPFSLTLALSFATWLNQFIGDVAKTGALAQRAITHAEQQGFPFWIGWAKVLRGWAASNDGNCAEGIVEIQHGLADWRAQGSELGGTYFLTLLADALARQGRITDAFDALADAAAFAEQTQEHYWLAERHRLEGELLLTKGTDADEAAEALFLQALELAARQQARSLELRAAISLAKLRRRQQRFAEMRSVLDPILAQFTEGFDTRDLLEAKALLATGPQSIAIETE